MAKAIVSGIYRIDGPNGKFYIGSALHIPRRWIEHKRDLRRGDHANPKFQAAWNRHGEKKFVLSVLEHVNDLEMLLEREQFWLDSLKPVENGYNILPAAGSRFGIKASEETKRKQSEAHKGRKHGPMSEAQKAHYSALYKGRKLSDATRKKMGDARRGKPRPQHVKDAVSKAQSEKIVSAETREKLAAANRGKKASTETIAKMKAAHANRRPISEETRQRLRDAAKRREQAKRQQAA